MSELTGLPWFIKIRKRHHPRPSMSANQFKDFFKSRPAASTLKSLQIVCRHRRSRMLGRFTIINWHPSLVLTQNLTYLKDRLPRAGLGPKIGP